MIIYQINCKLTTSICLEPQKSTYGGVMGFLTCIRFLKVFLGFWSLVCDRNLAATLSKKTYKSLLEHLLIIVIYPKVSKIYQIPDPKSGGVNWTPRCHRRILEEWVFGKGIAFQTWNCVVASSSLTPVGVSSIRIHKIRSTAIIWGPRHHLLGTETLT